MQSINQLRLTQASLRLSALGPLRLQTFRSKSDGATNESGQNVNLKSHFYPNTSVGIKERSVKPNEKPEPPMQTPYPPFPGGKNPKTGEAGGPTGPEPTRFGDWERKGRVTDF